MLDNIDYKLLWKQKMALLRASELLALEDDQNDVSDSLAGIVDLLDSIQDYAIEKLLKDEKDVFGYVSTNDHFQRYLRVDFFDEYNVQERYSFIENEDHYEVRLFDYSFKDLSDTANSYGYLLFKNQHGEYNMVCLSTKELLPIWVLAECVLETYVLPAAE